MVFVFGISERKGWFFTPTFHVYQKVNKRVYCYVSKAFGFYILQLYERGTADFCVLEARSKNIESLFELGEKWLQQYQDFNEEEIRKDRCFIDQPNWKEMCWI
jgi:hypothetical protein